MGRGMKNKIKNIFKILVVTAGCLMFASFSPSLDGRAVVVDEGVFPQGLFAKTVGYLPGDIISVTNIAGDKTIDLLVIGALDPSEGVAIMLSPEAADAMGIDRGSNNIVKITKRSGQDERVYGNAVISKSAAEIEDWDEGEYDSIGTEENSDAFEEPEKTELPEESAPVEEAPAFDEAAAQPEESLGEAEFEEPAVDEEAFEDAEEEAFDEETPAEETPAEDAENTEATEEEAFDENAEDFTDEEPLEENTLPADEAEEEAFDEEAAEDFEEPEEGAEEEALDSEELDALPEESEEAYEEDSPAEEEAEEAPAEEEAEEGFAEEAFDDEKPEELPAEPAEENAEESEPEAPEESEEEDAPAEEAFAEDELEALPEETEPEPLAADESTEATEEYEAIVLVPADSNPPESESDEVEDVISPDEFEELEDNTINFVPSDVSRSQSVIAPADTKAELSGKIDTKPAASATSYDKYIVPSLSQLESGKYYIQIAAYGSDENILEIINKYGSNYPVTIVPMAGGKTKQVLIGPVTMDEYKVVLERFKSYGFKDAFLRKIK